MEARAIANDIRISVDKANLVMSLIRNKSVEEAEGILKNMNQKASGLIKKVLASAVANAENNLGLVKTKLFVTKCFVNEGTTMKRVMFDSRGHTGRNDKRTSHITVIVSDKQ
jgi:large subunit ribosomal protein L22